MGPGCEYAVTGWKPRAPCHLPIHPGPVLRPGPAGYATTSRPAGVSYVKMQTSWEQTCARRSGERYRTCVMGLCLSRRRPVDEIDAPHRHLGDRHRHGPGRPPRTSPRCEPSQGMLLKPAVLRRARGSDHAAPGGPRRPRAERRRGAGGRRGVRGVLERSRRPSWTWLWAGRSTHSTTAWSGVPRRAARRPSTASC